jgi:hypothetical protein
MSSGERPGRPEMTPESILGDLAMWAHIRLGQAARLQSRQPGVVWFTRAGVAGYGEQKPAPEGSDTPKEGTVWYRLAETHVIGAPRQERFDVGVPVVDMAAPEPVPISGEEPGSAAFYVRKERRGVKRVQAVDLLSAAAFVGVETADVTAPAPLVTDLQTKLTTYIVQPMRVDIEG